MRSIVTILASLFLLAPLPLPSATSQVAAGQEALTGKSQYEAALDLLERLTLQEALLELKADCGLAVWESALLADLARELKGRRLTGRHVRVDPLTKTWIGPSAFSYLDPTTGFESDVALVPPPDQRSPRSWLLTLHSEGGVAVFAEHEWAITDILIGKWYVWTAYRSLECGGASRRHTAIGDDLVYVEPPREWGGVTGAVFNDHWLGRKVQKVVALPIPGPFTRWRLNPSTSQPEVLEYDKEKYFLPTRVISADEVAEISYNAYGIETTRSVLRNLGRLDASAGVLTIVKGPLLRSSTTKEFIFSKDPAQRVLVREWRSAKDGSVTIETSPARERNEGRAHPFSAICQTSRCRVTKSGSGRSFTAPLLDAFLGGRASKGA